MRQPELNHQQEELGTGLYHKLTPKPPFSHPPFHQAWTWLQSHLQTLSSNVISSNLSMRSSPCTSDTHLHYWHHLSPLSTLRTPLSPTLFTTDTTFPHSLHYWHHLPPLCTTGTFFPYLHPESPRPSCLRCLLTDNDAVRRIVFKLVKVKIIPSSVFTIHSINDEGDTKKVVRLSH